MRLPFVLADFTRIIWHSEDARAVWAPRIAKINQVWGEVERGAVVDSVRDSCLTFVDPPNLPEVSMWAAQRGLVVIPLATNGVASQYSSTATAVVAGRPFQYRIVLTRPTLAERWAKVWSGELDNRVVGELLGYPQCCREFFERVWVRDKGVDTTWEQAQGSLNEPLGLSNIRIAEGSPPETNIMLRWLGVRLVPHLPCSFNCQSTVQDAKRFADQARKTNPEVVDWIYEMLSWPAQWSALHGIAEIRTPVLTVSTRTNATGEKLVVERAGTSYPAEGSSGLRFPFRVVSGKVTDKPSFKRSVSPVHELNGFGSEASMVAAHDTLLSVLPSRDKETSLLLDLGCGTGRFLERAEAQGWTAVGVESDNARAGAAKVPVRRGDLLDIKMWNGEYDVVAFMPGRLLEDVAEDRATAVRQALLSRARAVLLYAYGDWLSKYGGLGPLAAAAGLGAGEIVKSAQGDGVEAALVVFNQEQQNEVRETASFSST
jgi:2-polyprenyl-3-methyl-5-hydroxy-6-metoxy-1,4-benzoquinol methylase